MDKLLHKKHVLIAGASGFIGTALISILAKEYSIIVVSRNPERINYNISGELIAINWDDIEQTVEQIGIKHIAGVINLAGENIASGYWTKQKKERLLSSRLQSAHKLINIFTKYPDWEGVFIQASAIGYYGNGGDQVLTESSEKGDGFLADLVSAWEASLEPLQEKNIRTVIMRIGLVLGKNGGLTKKLSPLFKFYLGGHPGSGRQWISWIHISDLQNFILNSIQNKNYTGTFNLVSPQTHRAKSFYGEFANVLGRPSWLHSPEFALRLVLGEIADEMLLISQKVKPDHLDRLKFDFKYDNLLDAFKNVLTD